jgi:HPt (histidine-containing phosphotransfer) domain-containing protein
MDIQMPVLDGLSATRIIRRLEQGEGVAEIEQDYAVIPAVLLERLRERLMGGHLTIASITANFISGDESEYLASGLDYNLPKPFQPEDITNFIRQFSPLAGGGVEDGIAVAANGSGSEAGSSGQETRKSVTVASRTEVEQFLREKYYFADDAIEMMMASLRESLRNNFAEATQALEREDFEGLSRVAHSIKGSLANIGFSELADQAHEIEVSALQRPDLPYAEMIARLQEPLSELM